jgi:hypothetical protein
MELVNFPIMRLAIERIKKFREFKYNNDLYDFIKCDTTELDIIMSSYHLYCSNISHQEYFKELFEHGVIDEDRYKMLGGVL